MKTGKIKLVKKSRDNRAQVNMLLYQFLLVATPFLLVRNFLQQAIGMLSQWSYTIAGLRIPYVLSAVIAFLLILLILNIRRFKLKAVLIFAGVIILMGIGQSFTDYYFNHDFYELQHNWHYFAYGLFAWISYLYHRDKGHSQVRYIWQTVLMGQLISIFDETAQIFISGRVFDVCDIGKDLWGAIVGIMVITAAVSSSGQKYKFKLWHKNPGEYFRNPYSSLFLLIVYGFLFLAIGSLLTETRYLLQVILWTLGIFILLMVPVYFLQYKIPRIVIIMLLAGLIILSTITISKNSQNIIIQKHPGLMEWRGISVPYFDLMIKKNGAIRLVDKKLYFNKKDKINRIYGMTEDILLIGSGSRDQGGKGFFDGRSHFVYNPITRRPLQILVYPNQQACRIYNKLNSEDRQVLFIIHNN